MSPWTNPSNATEPSWQTWWAWHPVLFRRDGLKMIVWLEPMLRRRVGDRWEYDLPD